MSGLKGGGGKQEPEYGSWKSWIGPEHVFVSLFFPPISAEGTSVYLVQSYVGSACRVQRRRGYASGRQRDTSLGIALHLGSFLSLLIHVGYQ